MGPVHTPGSVDYDTNDGLLEQWELQPKDNQMGGGGARHLLPCRQELYRVCEHVVRHSVRGPLRYDDSAIGQLQHECDEVEDAIAAAALPDKHCPRRRHLPQS